MVCAGNKSTDKAVVAQMSTALQSRLIHFELVASVPEFTEYATKEEFDYRIISFVNFMPSKLMDFKPDHSDKTFACPRTYEFLSRLTKGREITAEMAPRIAGTIGSGVGTLFMTFAKEFDRLPKLADIVRDPSSVPIPDEASTKYATISMLIENGNEENIEPIIDYVERFAMELQIVFTRGFNVRHPKLRAQNRYLSKYIQRMLRYLK